MIKKKQASESENIILNILLKAEEPLTVRQISEILNVNGIKWLTRTISTFLERLEIKGYVKHNKEGITNYYYPTVEKTDYQVKKAKKVLDTYFSGSFREMLSAFADRGELSDEELDSIENWIKEKGKNV